MSMNTNTKAQRAQYISSLKILANGPGKIADARAKYQAAKATFDNQTTRQYMAPATIEKQIAGAKAQLDKSIEKTVGEMRSALDYVKQERGNSAPFDPNDARIQNVINVVSAVGKGLDYSQQLDILEGFRGDPQGLKFVSTLFKRNGMEYSADAATRMAQDVSNQSLEDMEYSISKFELMGQWDESPIRWTRGEFARTLERFGESTEGDPYLQALADLKRSRREDAEAQKICGEAITMMQKSLEEGADTDSIKAIYNNAVSELEANE